MPQLLNWIADGKIVIHSGWTQEVAGNSPLKCCWFWAWGFLFFLNKNTVFTKKNWNCPWKKFNFEKTFRFSILEYRNKILWLVYVSQNASFELAWTLVYVLQASRIFQSVFRVSEFIVGVTWPSYTMDYVIQPKKNGIWGMWTIALTRHHGRCKETQISDGQNQKDCFNLVRRSRAKVSLQILISSQLYTPVPSKKSGGVSLYMLSVHDWLPFCKICFSQTPAIWFNGGITVCN